MTSPASEAPLRVAASTPSRPSSPYGLPTVGLLVATFAWLPLALVPILLFGNTNAPRWVVWTIGITLASWTWIQSRVGQALMLADRPVQRALWQRVWFGVAAAIVCAVVAAVVVGMASFVLCAVPLAIVLCVSPLVLLLVTSRDRVRRHLEAARSGSVAYYGRDRGLAQVGVAMIFVHSLSLLVKIPLLLVAPVLGLILVDVAIQSPADALSMTAFGLGGLLWCVKSLVALRLGWGATQGTVDPTSFVRRLRRYRIASWVSLALMVVAMVTDDHESALRQLGASTVLVPFVVVWPVLLGRFARRMQRESTLAGAFVPDPNRGLVVGGWLFAGGAVFSLFGTQLDWIPFFNAVAPSAHPSHHAALLYGGLCAWAAIEAIAQTSRARLAGALFGLFSLIYLPVAALLVWAGIGPATPSAISAGGYAVHVGGTLVWLAPLVPNVLLALIALGAKEDRTANPRRVR